MTDVNKKAQELAEDLKKQKKEESSQEITKQQVLDAALSYYLPSIMFQSEVSRSRQNVDSANLFVIDDDKQKIRKELPSYSNILTKKESDTKICELEIFKSLQENSLFLSQAVPYVKIYKTISKNGKQIDINLPFDIVAGQKYGDKESLEQKILQGGSGGAVGVANFSWKSEGKNEGNNSLYTVNFKIVLQDASELKKTRNIVGDNKVAILDLLYYGFLNSEKGSEKVQQDNKSQTTTTNETDYLEFKAELGFNFSSVYEKYTDYFKTMLNLRVYKHNFNFDQSGKVELEIIAIGNIESDFSNKVKHNILENEQTKNIVKLLDFLKKLQSLGTVEAMKLEIKKLADRNKNIYDLFLDTMAASEKAMQEKTDFQDIVGGTFGAVGGLVAAGIFIFSTAGLGAFALAGLSIAATASTFANQDVEDRERNYSFYKERIDTAIVHLKEYIKTVKLNILETIYTSLREKRKVRYFILENEQYNNLKNFISIGDVGATNLDQENIRKSLSGLAAAPNLENIDQNENTSLFSLEEKSYYTFSNVMSHVFADSPEGGPSSGKFTEKYNITPTDTVGSIKEKINKDIEPGKENEVISFISLGDLLQAFMDEDSAIKSDTNIFLGPFSFYNYGKSFSNLLTTLRNNKSSLNNNQNKYLIQNLEKEVGNLYNIPISVTSLQKWFKDLIESTDEKAYSFNKFLKFCMSDLIKQNIAVKSAPSSPYNTISINPYYFSVTDDKIKSLEGRQSLSIRELSNIYAYREVNNFDFTNIKRNIAFISVAEYALESDGFSGDFLQDCNRNIMHLFVNSMSSIVKSISFSRDDDARLETANLQAANDANPNKIIRQVYHANIDMFGNCLFEPGNLLYIKANYPGVPLGDKTLEEIGLGGYYRIINIENKITTSGFSTSLRCVWEMSSDGTKNVYGNNTQGIKVSLVNEND
jgi:hypothetical protein